MESYKSSTTTLRAILAHPSLQRSKIDETMEALAEANADAKEVDEAIRVGADVAIGIEGMVDEAELEEEWKAIVKEVEAEQEKEKEEGAKRRKLEGLEAIPKEVISEEESPAKDEIAVPSI
jgi:charged multivesicular body protein 7